ncbi:MAG: alpha-ketoacid dehydrogenase subunit beta [Legionellales bacterium]|nr:alpha-ketoacid dehydrogenase subunit beta [Legionellales bacterium]|tara:strand:- start:241 stop:1215 length:975 start_codon:yes stop_codon:yes gene_type:complete
MTIDIVTAINLALSQTLQNSANTVLLGQDIGKCGGVFRVTEGLQTKFGTKRVIDTPISESLLAGMAVGMSTHGLRPIVEFQFMGFLYPALDQIINHLARMKNRTRGRLSCPSVLRMPYGGGIGAPEHHSESTEALLAHIPGLKVVVPSTPTQAYHLLIEAANCNDPVIFLEPKRIYRSVREKLDTEPTATSASQPRVVIPGNDLTIIAWGAMLHDTIEASKQLNRQGIYPEIIDLVTLSPLNLTLAYESVSKTNRCLIIHEACESFGVGAEVGYRIFDHCFNYLEAPVKRLCSPDITIPYSKMEHHYYPQINDIIQTSQALVEY